jgi:hypothetical protein
MNRQRSLSGVVMQFSLAACLLTFHYMMTLSQVQSIRWYPLSLLLYGPLVYIINRIYLRRERTLRGLVLLNVLLGVLFFLLVCLEQLGQAVEILFFAAIFCLWLTVRGSQLALKGPTLHNLILVLDANALLLVLFTGYLSAMHLSFVWGGPIAAGFAAAVLGVVSNRMDQTMGPKQWIFLAGSFFLLSVFVWVLVGVVAAPAGEGIIVLWNGLVWVVQAVLGLLWKFFVFLASLVPSGDGGELEPPQAVEIPPVEELTGEANPAVLIVLAIFGALLLIAFLYWGLKLLGRLKIGGVTLSGNQKPQKRVRLSLWQGILKMLESWKKRIRLRLFLWRNRDYPIGLYYGMVHQCRMGPWYKRTGETPREFLERLRSYAGEGTDLSAALQSLIPCVDLELYGKQAEKKRQPFAQASCIHRSIRRTVRQQLFIKGRAAIKNQLTRNKKHK